MARNDSGGMGWFCLFEYNILKKQRFMGPATRTTEGRHKYLRAVTLIIRAQRIVLFNKITP